MRAHHSIISASVAGCALLVSSPVLAAPEQVGLVSTGVPFIDNVIAVVGALYLLLSAIAVFIPKDSKVGVFLSIIVADLRKRLEPTAAVRMAQAAKEERK